MNRKTNARGPQNEFRSMSVLSFAELYAILTSGYQEYQLQIRGSAIRFEVARALYENLCFGKGDARTNEWIVQKAVNWQTMKIS